MKVLNFDFYVMKPFPLQSEYRTERDLKPGSWIARMEFDKLSQSFPKSMRKLRELYGSMGFNVVKSTPLMVAQSVDFAFADHGFIREDCIEDEESASDYEPTEINLLDIEENG